MKQSPSGEANRSSASQGIPRILCNLKVHYRIHNSPSPVPILSQIKPTHTSRLCFLKICFNIVLQPSPESSRWSPSLRISVVQHIFVYVQHIFIHDKGQIGILLNKRNFR